jgi:ComF family protein
LKYKNLRSIAKPLANILCDYWQSRPFPGQVLVPVPLHPKRLKERGYNQSTLLSYEISRLSGLPVNDKCLKRAKFILPQARTQSVEERRRNVNNAFICSSNILKGFDVILIDDVSTSGATLDACAAALKDAGAKSVYGLVLAREI